MNDLADFKMPYKVYGNADLKVMKRKYLQLSNIPTSLLHVRFTK